MTDERSLNFIIEANPHRARHLDYLSGFIYIQDMHIDGKPLLSRATITSGRFLITFALGIILAKFYVIEPETITVLGAKLKTASLSAPAMWAIGFMLIGYLVNWYGDYTSFRAWNSGKPLQTVMTDKHSEEPFINQIESLVETIEQLKHFKDQVNNLALQKPELSEYLKKRSEELAQLQKKAENLKNGVQSLSKKVKFMLYGWHLAFPLGSAGSALYILGADI